MVEVTQEEYDLLQEAKAKQEAEAEKKELRKHRGKAYRAKRNHADQILRQKYEGEWKEAFESFNPEG